MIISVLAAIAIAPQGSLFARAFPNPTGDNAWEEYYRAFDVVAQLAVEPSLIAQNTLAFDKEIYERFGAACNLVRSGNTKRMSQAPKAGLEFMLDTMYERIARVFVAEARIRVAESKPSQTANSIATLLKFSQRLPIANLSDTLRSTTVEGRAWYALDFALHKLSFGGARELTDVITGILESPPPFLRAALESSRLYRELAVNALRNKSSLDDMDSSVPKELLAAGPADVDRYVSEVLQLIDQSDRETREMFAREERFWKPIEPKTDDPVLLFALRGHGMRFTMFAVLSRTRLRLAKLHCQIIEFKRTHNRWPEKLEELGGREVWYDPASGSPFYYARLTEQSYTLYSLGTSESGRIDLINRWQPK